MTRTLRGARALVTGASSGIGAATARTLAEAGCTLTLVGRDEQHLEDVATQLDGHVLRADLTSPTGLGAVEQACTEADVLVLNAGQGWAGDLTTMPGHRIVELTALNLTVPMQLTRAALPSMLRRGRGHLVFVSSIASLGVADEDVYAAGKAGIRTFATSVRHRARPHGVQVTTVLPGAVRTPFFDRRGKPYDRAFPRAVSPERVAQALVRGVRTDATEVFVPGWLSLAARLQALLPSVFARLSPGSNA